jgi:hypothetical protein
MPTSWPASFAWRISAAARFQMVGAGSSTPYIIVLKPYSFAALVRRIFARKPFRKMRRRALPLLSGPKLK